MIGRTDLWYKDAVIYCLDVETYQDSDGDGVGDFIGLTARLDYLVELGITCIWLSPFFPSPNRDNGYDIADYYGVDERLGTLGDFVDFARAARERGIRLIADLVVNHTSDQHPWFQAARRDPESRYRDFYVWSKTLPADATEGIIFPGEQESIWTWDEEAELYYMHRFYNHQPDLNVANDAVREEIRKIMGYWLELGVSGFRVDAVPFFIEHKGIHPEHIDEDENPFGYLDQMREFLQWRKGDAVLLAEANIPMTEAIDYFGESGQRMHLIFHFPANQALFLSLARREATPLARVLAANPEIPRTSQWAQFLRNHDELDIGRLSDAERADVFADMGPDEDMQLFERGIRRRLAPMLGGDRARIELAYSLMLSMPGTPVFWYGQEIGMGDNLGLEGRAAVRTPMQWSPERNGGFSSVQSNEVFRPVNVEGEYGYPVLNVRDQRRDPDSLLRWMKRMIHVRRDCPEWGWGRCVVLDTANPAVLAYGAQWEDGRVVAVHNMADAGCTVTIALDGCAGGEITDLLRHEPYELDGDSLTIDLEPYAYRWFRVITRNGRPPLRSAL